MKKVMLFFVAYYTVIISCAHGKVAPYTGDPYQAESDSTVVFFVREIHTALAKKDRYVFLKDKEHKRYPEPTPADIERMRAGSAKGRGLPRSVPSVMPLSVMMYPSPSLIPVDSLYRFQMEEVDSLNIIFKSPWVDGGYIGRGRTENMVVFMPQGKKYRKTAFDLLKVYGTDRYKDRSWKNDRGADSTLLLFVQDLYAILEEENVRRKSTGQETLDLQRQVVIDDKVVPIADLDRYSIFDIAYMTVRFRRPEQAQVKNGVIFLTTFK